VPAAAALDVEGVDRPPAERRVGVLEGERLVEAVRVDGELDVLAVGDVERAADLVRAGGDVLVDLQARAARPQRGEDGSGARTRPARAAPR
jgi:hypothetical protein